VTAWTLRARIAKYATTKDERGEEQHLVFGVASMVTDADGRPLIDHGGDVIPVECLEEAAYDYVEASREMGLMHETTGHGHLVESVVITPAKREALGLGPGPSLWWVGYRVTDPDVWRRIKSGELSELSIGGTAAVATAEVQDAYYPA